MDSADAAEREQHLVATIPGCKRARVIGRCELLEGDCMDVLRGMKSDSVNSIVTDPPYGLSFMGKVWDHQVPSCDIWAEALRVLKPGGHLLAFAGTRTQHRMAVAIEDAGFEIRDMIAWVYGSGFPKSQNVSKAIDKALGAKREVVGRHAGSGMTKANVEQGAQQRHTTEWYKYSDTSATPEAQQWDGWGAALKPALEPITVARKPLAKGNTVAKNVLQYGTGAINVDGCRVGWATFDERDKVNKRTAPNSRRSPENSDGSTGWGRGRVRDKDDLTHAQSRWPANLIHDGSDEVTALFPVTHGAGTFRAGSGGGNIFPARQDEGKNMQRPAIDAGGTTSRFFYCAKASKKDRGEGNTHPTVKPTDLMRYLCRLVTPPGGIVLDPFMGSGSTGKAAGAEGFAFCGVERDKESFDTATARIEVANQKPRQEGFDL